MNNIKLISTINEYDSLKDRELYSYICKKCGKQVIRHKRYEKNNDKFGRSFICYKCGSKQTKLERYGNENFVNPEKAKQTYMNKTGYDSPMHNPECKNKLIKTIFKRYGVDNISKSEYFKEIMHNYWNNTTDEELKKIKNKSRLTSLKKYGVDNPSKNEYIKKKLSDIRYSETLDQKLQRKKRCEQTVFKKYGVKHICQSPEIKTKIELTKINRYGDKYYNNREKRERTCMEKYGQYSNMNTDDFRRKSKETCLNRYGKQSYIGSEKWKYDMHNTYGTLHVGYKYNYYGVHFDSSWELAVWIYCIDNGISIIRNPCTFNYTDMYDKIRYYEPDFMINGQLVEIKGNQYFDNNGNMIYPYNKLHHDSNNFTKEEKKYMDDLYNRKYKCIIDNNVLLWKEEDILPYLEYCNNEYPNWNILFRKDNIFNPSYYIYTIPLYNNGITPFDINKNDKYVDISGKGLTPFDI